MDKGNKVVSATGPNYIENVKAGQQIELIEKHGLYHMDVDFFVEGFAKQVSEQ